MIVKGEGEKKKILSIIVSIALAISITACSKVAEERPSSPDDGAIKEIYLGEEGNYHITITFCNGMDEEINFKDISLIIKDAKDQEIVNISEYAVNIIVEEKSSSDFLITIPAPEGAGKLGEGVEWSISYEWEWYKSK